MLQICCIPLDMSPLKFVGINEYKLRLFMVWHESTNPTTTTAMEQRGRRRVHKTKGEAEGPMEWQDQRSKKMA